jgi:PAS domain S-box-containing protein
MGTWRWELEPDELRLSAGARAVLGVPGDPDQAYTFEEITTIVRLGEPQRIDELLRALREGGPPVQIRTNVTTPAGERKELESRIEAVRDADGTPRELRGIVQDITERHRAEREREAVLAVTRALAEAVTVDEAIEGVLAALAETTDWRAGTYWCVDDGGRGLRCERVWLAPGHEGELEPLADASGVLRLGPGEGVPGTAWSERRPVWREVTAPDDVHGFPRRLAARASGLAGVFAVPVMDGDEVIGVIDLWRDRPGEPPHELAELIASFGRQVGQFVVRTRAESKLQESRALMSSVIDAALEAVITIDAVGHVIEWNPAAERTFGYGRHEVVGRELADLIVPARHRQRHRQGLGRASEGGEGRLLDRRVEIEAVRASGEEFPVELTISRIGADPPTYTGWVRDITERRRAEAAVRESRRLLAETQLLARIGSWQWDMAADEVRASEEVHRLLDLPADAGPISFGRMLEAVHADHREELRTAVERCAGEDRPLEYQRTPLALEEGSVRVVEWFAAPVGRDGEVRVVHGTVQNVTPEAELEAELATRARQQAAVAQLGSEALFATDIDVVMESAVATVAENLDVEHCAVMELLESGEGLLMRAGVGWEEGMAGSLVVPTGTASHAGAVIAGGRPLVSRDLAGEERFEVPAPLLDHGIASAAGVVIAGDAGPVGSLGAYSSTPGRFTDDDVVLLQGIANVLAAAFASERAAALERRLQQAQRLDSVGKLAGGIAHDFNNLLGVILNYADFALAAADEGTEGEILEIKLAAERAAALTRQLLLFSRKDVARDEVVDAASVVVPMEPILSRAVGEHMRLEIRIESGLPPVRLTQSLLEQVVLNLVLNAGDATPGGGRIVIEVANAEPGQGGLGPADGRHVRLSVIDEGSGMSQDVVDRAFEPFFTTKPEGRGTGLGLPTCYGIVQRAGGRIEIDSEPGAGTKMHVYLRAGVEAATEREDDAEDELGPQGGGETVLLVEDEEPLRRVTRRILEAAGYVVLDAGDPEAAMAIWREFGPEVDVLLTDVVMPERSGIELWRELAAERPELEAIYMSGYSADVVARGEGDEPRRLLEKPFTSVELLGAVRAAIGGS